MILTDQDLRALIDEKQGGLITGYNVPSDWDSKDSFIQPSSVDLHVGAIFSPGVKVGKPGSAGNPKSSIALKTGETAIVETKESINLGAEYAAIGFPPADVSAGGLLMTNPGHVDPGFSGKLSFTVINMGREEFVLHPAIRIVTLLVFKLATPVGKDYASRKAVPQEVTAGTMTPFALSNNKARQDLIDRLSSDFVDVERRAKKKALSIFAWTTFAATAFASLATYATNSIENRASTLDEVKTKIVQLQSDNLRLRHDLESTKGDLEKEVGLESKLAAVELELKAKGLMK